MTAFPRFYILWLAIAFAIGCGSGGAGQGGAAGSGGAGGGGAGNDGGCVASFDQTVHVCEDGVVSKLTACSSTVIGNCPFGCKVVGWSSALTPVEYFCNEDPDAGDGGAQDACGMVSDNVYTTCLNGVLTTSTICPAGSNVSGTCPYGCKYPGNFGPSGTGLCNDAPGPDAGCDGACGDAADASDAQ